MSDKIKLSATVKISRDQTWLNLKDSTIWLDIHFTEGQSETARAYGYEIADAINKRAEFKDELQAYANTLSAIANSADKVPDTLRMLAKGMLQKYKDKSVLKTQDYFRTEFGR